MILPKREARLSESLGGESVAAPRTNRFRPQRLIEIAVSIGFLALAVRAIDLRELWATLRTANYLWVIPGILVTVALLFWKAWRWQMLFLPEHHVSFRAVLTAQNAGYLASNVLPARAGEVVRLLLVVSDQKVSAARTLSTMVVERLLDIVTLLVLMVVMLPFVQLPEGITRFAQLLGVIAVAGSAILVFFSYRKAQLVGLAHRILGRVKFLDRPGAYAAIGHLIDGFAALRGRLGLALLLNSFIGWLAVVVMAWTSARAVHLALPVSTAAFSVVLTTLAMLLPSSPGYIGVFHYWATQALAPFGVPYAVAFSFALVWHAANYLTLCTAGVISLWTHGTSIGEVFGQLRNRGGVAASVAATEPGDITTE